MDNKKIQNWIKNKKIFTNDLTNEIANISEKIVDKKFSHATHGYDADEVDKEIDNVLRIYEKLRDTIIAIFEYTCELDKLVNGDDSELDKLKKENEALKFKLEKLQKEGYGNIEILNRLEKMDELQKRVNELEKNDKKN